MKGIVFTEFLDMIDEKFGIEVTESVISNSKTLSTGGSYTAVGTYPHHEMVQMVVALSEATSIPVPQLIEVFGKHLFTVLSSSHAPLMKNTVGLFDFLEKIESYIHIEVRKLYPDAELPRFETRLVKEGKSLEMIYYSERSMSALAVGLIKGASEYFKEPVDIETTDISEDGSGSKVRIDVSLISEMA